MTFRLLKCLNISICKSSSSIRYFHKIPEELPELELKATFGLAAPIPFEVN